MNKLIFISIMAALSPTLSQASTSQLRCHALSEHSNKSFNATLDYSAFDEGSGLFRVTGATITDNYANARLICAGYRLDDVECVGFWFNQPGRVANVRIHKSDDGYVAEYETLRGDIPVKGGPLPCSVE